MESKISVPYRDPATGAETEVELRIGKSSSPRGYTAMKFAWRDKRGHVARGGEIPMEALPQMLEFAIREGGLRIGPVQPRAAMRKE